jgi:hypothetical protein
MPNPLVAPPLQNLSPACLHLGVSCPGGPLGSAIAVLAPRAVPAPRPSAYRRPLRGFLRPQVEQTFMVANSYTGVPTSTARAMTTAIAIAAMTQPFTGAPPPLPDPRRCSELLFARLPQWPPGVGRQYGIRVPKDQFPGSFFMAKDACDSKSKRRDVVAVTDLGVPLFYLVDACDVGPHMLGDSLRYREVAVPEPGGRVIEPLSHVTPSAYRRPERICERHVLSMREDCLDRLRVASGELAQGRVIPRNYLIKIIM